MAKTARQKIQAEVVQHQEPKRNLVVPVVVSQAARRTAAEMAAELDRMSAMKSKPVKEKKA